MSWRENFSRLGENLARLGARRLVALGLAGVLMAVAVAVAGYMLSRPAYEVLYTGLSPRDVTAIGAALSDARIRYDVSADGKSVKVDYGRAAEARMLLAGKGLPRSARAGYELFDNIGALGLTSFMQNITLIRALEGELARTIQNFAGVKAARVHIVLARRNGFRREGRKPSASVLIRTDAAFQPRSAQSIRYLVAGAVPGLSIGDVSVVDTDGSLLASGEDRKMASPRHMVELETRVAGHIRQNVLSTLMPYLGAGNFQVSVDARLNTDRKRTSQTIYDPASRVERSVRDIKEKSSSDNSSKSASASVDQEIPGGQAPSGPARKTREQRDHKERLTNYEISSRKIETISDGYGIARMSIAVVVNRKSLETVLGHKLSPEDMKSQEKEIAGLVATAAGIDKGRGDQLKITMVDFIQSQRPLPPVEGVGMMARLLNLVPLLINTLAVLAVTGLLVWFGVRPALKILDAPPVAEAQLEGPAETPRLGAPEGEDAALNGPVEGADEGAAAGAETLAMDILDRPAQRPLEMLRQMIEHDEKQAANVLREWLHEEAGA